MRDVKHSGGRTRLIGSRGLVYSYNERLSILKNFNRLINPMKSVYTLLIVTEHGTIIKDQNLRTSETPTCKITISI